MYFISRESRKSGYWATFFSFQVEKRGGKKPEEEIEVDGLWLLGR